MTRKSQLGVKSLLSFPPRQQISFKMHGANLQRQLKIDPLSLQISKPAIILGLENRPIIFQISINVCLKLPLHYVSIIIDPFSVIQQALE